MKKVIIIIVAMSSLFASAQQPISNKGNRLQTYPDVTVVNPDVEALVNEVSMQNLENSIRWMQQFIRHACSPAALETQNWLIEHFESFGLDVYVHYFPAVDIVYKPGLCKTGDTLDAGNVVAIQRGTEFPDEYIVISSHYDHPDGPGADDNASGTAGVVEIARILSQHSFKRSIIYVPFNGEELYMVGSLPFAEKCAREDLNILGVFNLDMLGFFPEDVGPLTMSSGSSKISDRLWEYYQTVANLYVTDIPTFRFSDGDSYGGDHMPFNIYEYPALYIGDIEYHYGYNHCYHKSCDTLGSGVNSLPLAQGFVKATLASVVELANGWLPPQNLSAIPSDAKITVSWDAAPETSNYKLFKNNVLLTETSETSYVDTDVMNGTEYIYYVKGIRAGSGEESPESNRDSIAASLPLPLPYFNDFEENTDGWRLNPEWERTTTQHYSGNSSFTSGKIFQNHFSTAELCWLSIPDTATNVSLSFYFRGSVSGEFWKESNGFVEISTDRKRWNKVMKISKNYIQDWCFCQISLNQYIGEPFVQIRIRVESSGQNYNYSSKGQLFFDDLAVNFTAIQPKPIPENLQITLYSGTSTSVGLAWDKVAEPVKGYNIYRNNMKINPSLITINKYYDIYSPTSDDCYQVTAVYPDVESDFSNEACIKDVGISEIIPFSNLKITPNPSNGNINIETGVSSDYHLAIYNMMGVKVFEKELFTDGALDVSNLPKGMYILKITTKDDGVAKKIVIN
ncbi:MAG: M28 family peptidase [Bacteroidales bacterium]|nr:M28 family peptidase [Bacteroidales bacterium]